MDSLRAAIKSFALKLSAPVRWMVRHELWALELSRNRNIEVERQRLALKDTAEYVEARLAHVDSFTSQFDLLTAALQHARNRDGLFLEFGVYSGQTINHIAGRIPCKVYGFDSFEGLPERWRDGIGPGFFKVDRLPPVRPNVVLVKGWFDQSLPPFLKEQTHTVAFMHVDCDLYSSTKTVFELLRPRLEPGTVIVFDEYFNYPGWRDGEYKAFQEFLRASGLSYKYIGYNRWHEQVAVVLGKAGAPE